MLRDVPVIAEPSLLEALLNRERVALAVLLVGLPSACWIWVVAMARDMYGPMTGSAGWMMTARWDLPYVVLLWAMWAAMMAGMMLPSAAPLMLLYVRAARRRVEGGRAALDVYALVAGYTLVWAGFSVGATLVQWLLGIRQLLTPMMEPSTGRAAAGLLLIAGLYQLTPLKQACLRSCRTPVSFLASRWREGTRGALLMGAEHGAYCLGCCWALMLMLFAGGVMNLAVVAALTLWVAVEKTAPFGQQSARVGGALLVAASAWLFVQ